MKVLFSGPLLIITAHPDDMELMAGGIAARAASQNVDVYSMVISDGCENGDVKIRKNEMMKSARLLGIKEVKLCGCKDGRIAHTIDMVTMVEQYLNDIDPSVVITHTTQDTHQDHKNVCNITLSATRLKPKIVLMGETPSSHLGDNLVYFDITDNIDAKIKALKVYKSQISNGPVDINEVKTLASFRGSKAKVKYAEAFINWRMLL